MKLALMILTGACALSLSSANAETQVSTTSTPLTKWLLPKDRVTTLGDNDQKPEIAKCSIYFSESKYEFNASSHKKMMRAVRSYKGVYKIYRWRLKTVDEGLASCIMMDSSKSNMCRLKNKLDRIFAEAPTLRLETMLVEGTPAEQACPTENPVNTAAEAETSESADTADDTGNNED